MINQSITILLPVYNEEQNVRKMVKELDNILVNLFQSYEVLVVESGSTDNTAKVLDDLKNEYSCLNVINEGAKNGLGSGIRTGIKKTESDIIVYMDSDIPFDLNVLNKVFPMDDEVDVLVGYRTGTRETFARWFFSKGYNIMIKSLFGIKVRDVNYSFKVLRKKVYKDLNLISNGWFIDAEILARVTKRKCKISQVGIPYKHRESGESVVRINHKLIFGMLKEMWDYYKDEKNNCKC
ncbi:glycosyltransferase family 2 protein [archaeon]|nr:glycosyltransferase family 2 protein [archaeon]MBT5030174.1 glycosyltransferase family 2 protein [archaeon]MBT5287707.1 glycosyltransferase family 2 protein [archaeon]MBT7281294.1 glycosyltransferase family 2 protein [archaeon]